VKKWRIKQVKQVDSRNMMWRGVGDMSYVQICQKKILVHENIHDKRHKYIKI
jgi:hypothetical protein